MWLYLIALVGTSAFAASGDEFYARLLTRGVSQFNEGNYAGAYSSMKVAAFGFLEDIPRFQTAEIYMTIAANKLKRESDARVAAQRVVAAERIEKRYASLSVPAEVRTQFEEAARKLLTPDQFAALRGGGAARPPQSPPQTPPQTPPKTPQPQPPPKTKEIIIPAPVVVPAPQPPPASKAPNTTTQAPAPAPRVQPPAPQPKPVLQPQPQPAPMQPAPVPVPVPVQPRPVPPQPQPQPPPPQTPPVRPPADAGSLADADRAVNSGDLATARSLYRSILDAPQLSHATALRVGEGLYRSRDFAGVIRAFERAGAIGKGEEQYHYYYAVALYESGRYGGAKRELRAALPFIEVTPDVERYRVKIEGAIE